jgi:hypothetical protein
MCRYYVSACLTPSPWPSGKHFGHPPAVIADSHSPQAMFSDRGFSEGVPKGPPAVLEHPGKEAHADCTLPGLSTHPPDTLTSPLVTPTLIFVIFISIKCCCKTV